MKKWLALTLGIVVIGVIAGYIGWRLSPDSQAAWRPGSTIWIEKPQRAAPPLLDKSPRDRFREMEEEDLRSRLDKVEREQRRERERRMMENWFSHERER